MRAVPFAIGVVFAVLSTASIAAAEVSVAVAANFTKVAEELAVAFKARTGNDLVLSFGATGALYTQITQGAPFEVFLAADTSRPTKSVDEGFGVAGTSFTYAIGRLVLYSPSLDLDGGNILKTDGFQHIAIADPATAPYGAAAIEALTALGLSETLTPRLVTGESISQTLQFVETGNAELGFVALSQVMDKPAEQFWRVPVELYAPILQDAVLLKTGEANPAAIAFLDFLKTEDAAQIIRKAGYEID